MTDAKTPEPLWQNEKTGEPWKSRLSGLSCVDKKDATYDFQLSECINAL